MNKLTPQQRDEFLDKAAMMAISVCEVNPDHGDYPSGDFTREQIIAQKCYWLAKALLAEREKREDRL